mgnify:CR=1 FL=1
MNQFGSQLIDIRPLYLRFYQRINPTALYEYCSEEVDGVSSRLLHGYRPYSLYAWVFPSGSGWAKRVTPYVDPDLSSAESFNSWMGDWKMRSVCDAGEGVKA